MLGDEPGALEDLLEVALGQPLALGDHAEAVRAGGLGGAGVLEDLLGLHHRVQRRLGLGEPRLRAEAAVLGAAAGLRVDQRAHVGRVAEALRRGLPGALDQRLDVGVVGRARPRREGLLAGDERRHGRQAKRRGRTAGSQNWERQIARSGDFGTERAPCCWTHMSPRFVRSAPQCPSPIRVLLCDDVQAFRALIRYSLEDEDGIEVVGEAATATRASARPPTCSPT